MKNIKVKKLLCTILFAIFMVSVAFCCLSFNNNSASADYIPKKCDWIYAKENCTVEYSEKHGWKVLANTENDYSFYLDNQVICYYLDNEQNGLIIDFIKPYEDVSFSGNFEKTTILLNGKPVTLDNGKIKLDFNVVGFDKDERTEITVSYLDSDLEGVGAVYFDVYTAEPSKSTWVKSSNGEVTYTDTYGWRIKSNDNKAITINKEMVAYYISRGATSMAIQFGGGGDYATLSGAATPLHLYCYADAPAKGTGAKISVGANYIYNFIDETVTVDLTDEQFDFINYEMSFSIAGIAHGQCDSAYIQSIKFMRGDIVVSEIDDGDMETSSKLITPVNNVFDGEVFLTEVDYPYGDGKGNCNITYVEGKGWHIRMDDETSTSFFYINKDLLSKYLDLGYEKVKICFDSPFAGIDLYGGNMPYNTHMYLLAWNIEGGATTVVNGNYISGFDFTTDYGWGPTAELTKASGGLRFILDQTQSNTQICKDHFITALIFIDDDNLLGNAIIQQTNLPNECENKVLYNSTYLSVDYDFYNAVQKQFMGSAKFGTVAVLSSDINENAVTHKFLQDNSITYFEINYSELLNDESALLDGKVYLYGNVFENKDITNDTQYKVVSFIEYKEFGKTKYIYFDEQTVSVNNKSYSVAYELNGGTNANENKESWTAIDSAKLYAPTLQYYEFVAWYSDNAFTNRVDVLSKELINNDSVTLYAKFIKQRFTVTFDTDGGTAFAPVKISWGEQIPASVDPVKENYEFVCWTLNGEKYTFGEMPKEDITLVASYKGKEFSITKNSVNNGTLTVDDKGNYSAKISFSISLNTGYAVDEVSVLTSESLPVTVSFENGNYYFTMPADDVEISVTTKLADYTVTYVGTLDATNQNPTTVKYTDNVTLVDISKEDYVFNGWYSDEQFQNKITQLSGVSQNISVYAKLDKVQYTVTFDSNGGSAVSSITLGWGEELIEPTSPTKENCIFVCWMNGDKEYVFDVMPKENITLTAYYVFDSFNIQIEKPNGVSHTIPSTALYNDRVSFSVTVPNGYRIDAVKVSKSNNDALTCSFENGKYFFFMPSCDVKVVITIKVAEYAITYFNVEGATNSNPTSILGNQTVQLQNATKNGFSFEGWYLDEEFTQKVTSLSNPTDNINLYAKFVENKKEESGLNCSSSIDNGSYAFLIILAIIPCVILAKKIKKEK